MFKEPRDGGTAMKRFSIGDKVVHSPEGVCEIEDICIMDVDKEKKQFYKLRSVVESDKVLYISCACKNPAIRHLKSVEEAERILKLEAEEGILSQCSNVEKRITMQKRAIMDDNSELLIRLIKTYVRNSQYKEISVGDNNWLKAAEKYLLSELAELMGVSYTDMQQAIAASITKDFVFVA